MLLGFETNGSCPSPTGTAENNPAIYRWVDELEPITSPGGGTEELVSRLSFAPAGAWRVVILRSQR
jgi:hypothetical protein